MTARRRPGPVVRALGPELAAIGFVAGYNEAAHRRVPGRARIAANLGAAAALVAAARLAGATWADLGMTPSTARRGLRCGLAVALPIVGGAVLAVAHPRTRHLLADERIAGATPGAAAFETLVRIPLETALAEEVIFRGVLLGIGRRAGRSVGAAITTSSALFGLWHVRPTIASLDRGAASAHTAQQPVREHAAVAAVVATTALAGAGFAALRLYSGNVLAPVLAHAALNVAAYTGVWVTARDR